jgi:hypothetical protein
MQRTGEHQSIRVKTPGRCTDYRIMTPRRRSLFDRLAAWLQRRRGPRVLVIVNTTSGPRAVSVPVADLE